MSRSSDPGPYAGLTEEELLDRATAALEKVTRLPIGSMQRAIQWGVHESAMAELDRRLTAIVRAKLSEEGDE